LYFFVLEYSDRQGKDTDTRTKNKKDVERRKDNYWFTVSNKKRTVQKLH